MLNGDRNTGEFRSYNQGYLTLKTDNQGDLKIKWNKILSILSEKTFEIELVDGSGERMTARLRREDVDHLELMPGEIVWATPEHSRSVPTPP